MFFSTINVAGGPAPVRAYGAGLLPDVMEGRIEPAGCSAARSIWMAFPAATGR
jgi:hypothetical protein